MSEPSDSLREQFGDIDVYLFDQLLRGQIVSGMKVLDAGCGSGRNLIFLLRAGFDVWGVDESEEAIAAVQHLATELAQDVTPRRFRVERVESMSQNLVIPSEARASLGMTRHHQLEGAVPPRRPARGVGAHAAVSAALAGPILPSADLNSASGS